jgi:hypothetical protein
MKTFVSIFATLLLLTSQFVYSHSDHAHGPISEVQAQALAASVASQLSTQDAGLGIGKLPASWAEIAQENVSMHKKGNGYYIVAINNTSENKTLFVLLSNTGKVYDANFTGTFKDLK